jgi:hypothetical protein
VRQLQCKTLRGREKSRRRKNNGEQWKNNASSDRNNEVRNQRWRSTRQQKPAVSSGGRRSHKSETRISAFADLSREGKQKAAPLSPAAINGRFRQSHFCRYGQGG